MTLRSKHSGSGGGRAAGERKTHTWTRPAVEVRLVCTSYDSKPTSRRALDLDEILGGAASWAWRAERVSGGGGERQRHKNCEQTAGVHNGNQELSAGHYRGTDTTKANAHPRPSCPPSSAPPTHRGAAGVSGHAVGCVRLGGIVGLPAPFSRAFVWQPKRSQFLAI